MRDKQLKQIVSNHTTGVAEADMLGQVLLWVERQNRPYSHQLHRKQLKKYSFLSRSEVAKMIAYGGGSRSPSVFKRALEWFKTPLRKLKALEDKAEQSRPKYLSGLRKNKRNGN
jgi:hypothetical protein